MDDHQANKYKTWFGKHGQETDLKSGCLGQIQAQETSLKKTNKHNSMSNKQWQAN